MANAASVTHHVGMVDHEIVAGHDLDRLGGEAIPGDVATHGEHLGGRRATQCPF